MRGTCVPSLQWLDPMVFKEIVQKKVPVIQESFLSAHPCTRVLSCLVSVLGASPAAGRVSLRERGTRPARPSAHPPSAHRCCYHVEALSVLIHDCGFLLIAWLIL